MGQIVIEGIKLYCYHGCMEEEAKIGANYSVDITIDYNFSCFEYQRSINNINNVKNNSKIIFLFLIRINTMYSVDRYEINLVEVNGWISI